MNQQKLAQVLYVEDSSADIALTKAILKRLHVHMDFFYARDGQEAIDRLKERIDSTAQFNLIFLDFNLPKISGVQVLSYIKSNERTKHVPVVMLSGSDSPKDIKYARELGAVDYIVKPIALKTLESAVSGANLDWIVENDEICVCVRSNS